MATDLLTTIRGEIEARLFELRPLLGEYEELISAEQALAAGGGEEIEAAPRTDAGRVTGSSGPRTRYSRPGPRRASARVAARARADMQARADAESKKAVAPPKAATKQHATTKPRATTKPQGDATAQAIRAALEHGSHTTSELVMVTALSAQSIRRSLVRLERAGTIGRTRRDRRTAYVLSSTSA